MEAETTHSISAPKQARSQKTLDSLVEAAIRLIKERGFEQAGVARICREAGVTTGAFYARFSGKEDLLFLLIELLQDRLETATNRLKFSGETLDKDIEALLRKVLKIYRENGALIHTLTSHSYRNREIADALRAVNSRWLQRLVVEIKNADCPQLSDVSQKELSFALIASMGVMRDMALEHLLASGQMAMPDRALIEESSRLFKGYVGVG